ncbi:hypothetical protein J7I98_12705 [Streptomyces sp. ISL-98]|uniref:hypothetical protein n=1 Tax=Streptomyces sp. ISL-98 TaxID=2819192 RepID=UPI001BE94094|nr:hypothetical protein [Streptomyces sp. ISL-98]MBT2506734.1 hypothetical protein [Streptomyces sp. ISL-98]
MRKHLKYGIYGLAILIAAAGLTLAGPGAQSAEAADSTCAGRKVKTVSFATGELRIYKSRRYVCAMTVSKSPGVRRHMSVTIQARGSRTAKDSGHFTHRAGPVKVYALNRCVRAEGSIGIRKVSTGWILC